MNKQYDVCVIGGGAAGMSCALGAVKNGAKVLLIERNDELGGILQQCIHNGFGIHHYHEELTGPAYAERLMKELHETDVDILLGTTVLKITLDKMVHIINEESGYQIIKSKTIVVAVGCHERTRHQIGIPGKRLAGIMTAGLAQRYLNIDGYLVGKKVFILGSGDIGLIMARRMTLEGAKVLGVAEIMPYSNGLVRNIVQCLDDYGIPLYLNHTVTDIIGKDRLEKIIISEVDENYQIKDESHISLEVDTLLLSIGLIPENKLLLNIGADISQITNGPDVDDNYQTSIPGVFSCGNSLHVHDLVDYVSEESFETGRNAALIALGENQNSNTLLVKPSTNVRYIIPNKIKQNQVDVIFKFRVTVPIDKGEIIIKQGRKIVKTMKKRFLLPSEMQSILLNKSYFDFNNMENIFVEAKGYE